MNPQVERLIEMLKELVPADAPKLWEVTPAEARSRADAFCGPLNAGGPEMAETRDIVISGRRGPIPARLYVPRDIASPSPGLLYLHGGGFMLCSPETHDRLTRELAEGLGARAVSVNYGLAPECPYPDGLHDCVDAARWLGEHGAELGIDVDRLLIGGDSAGANLTAATLLKLRHGDRSSALRDERCGPALNDERRDPALPDEGHGATVPGAGRGPAFRGALLIYGRFAGGDTPSITAWGDRDLILSRPFMDWCMQHYTGGKADPEDPYFAPLAADLTGFPPAVLVVGTLDPLLSDSELFAAALEKAGVQTELHVFEDGIHAFLQMPGLDMTAEAIKKLCAFGRRRLGS